MVLDSFLTGEATGLIYLVYAGYLSSLDAIYLPRIPLYLDSPQTPRGDAKNKVADRGMIYDSCLICFIIT